MNEDDEDIRFEVTRTEKGLDYSALVAGFTPVVGGAISGVLSGISQQRKLNRVAEIIHGLEQNLSGFKSEVMDEYVKTEDFEELLEQTLRRVADERSAEMRALYGNFLSQAIKYPCDEYEDQFEILRALEQLNLSHVSVIAALEQAPEANAHTKIMGSAGQTLRERTGFDDDQIETLVQKLTDLHIIRLGNLKAMGTGLGMADLRHAITPLGRKVMKYVRS